MGTAIDFAGFDGTVDHTTPSNTWSKLRELYRKLYDYIEWNAKQLQKWQRFTYHTKYSVIFIGNILYLDKICDGGVLLCALYSFAEIKKNIADENIM